jgi:histidyl-tRNA synthetase
MGKSSEELVKEQTFQVTDKNGDTFVMRPEMTPSLARMVASKSNQLIFPLRLFNLGLRYRYEAPQKGREREFYQADFDLLGSDSLIADAEILSLSIEIFKSLGAKKGDFIVYVNSRKELENYLVNLGYVKEQTKTLFKAIDRQDKVSNEEFIKLLLTIDGDKEKAEKLVKFLNTARLEDSAYFVELAKIMEKYGYPYEGEKGYWQVNYNITRGLDYYTGIVFEVKEIGGMKRSLLGGGRYDNLVASYNPSANIQGVGFATSDVVLLEFIKDKNLIPQLTSKSTKYLVTVFGEETVSQSVTVAQQLRTNGVAAEVYPDSGKKLDKQIKYADRNGIPYIIIIGSEEVAKNIVKVKNLKTGEQKEVSMDKINTLS